MAEADLFIALAGVAGVFVGFGALISAGPETGRSGAQLGRIRTSVTNGLVVIVAALIPVTLARYQLSGHALWLASSLIFLVISWMVIVTALRRAEFRELALSQVRSRPIQSGFFWVMLELPVQVPLLMTVLGINPDLEPAYYLTALVFNLFQAAFVLTQFVYAQEAA